MEDVGAVSMPAVEEDSKIVHLKGRRSLSADGTIVGKNHMHSQVLQVSRLYDPNLILKSTASIEIPFDQYCLLQS